MVKLLKNLSPDTADGQTSNLIDGPPKTIVEPLHVRTNVSNLRGRPVPPVAKRTRHIKATYRHVVGVKDVQFVSGRKIPITMAMRGQIIAVPCRHIGRRGRTGAKRGQ